MKSLLSLLFAIGLAGPAVALSCIAPTIEDAYTFARDSEDAYLPVMGHFDGFEMRGEIKTPNPQDRVFTARFTGHVMSARGKGDAVELPVRVVESCVASWCGSLHPDVELLTFLRRDEQGYHFVASACGGNAFANPTPDQIRTLRRCFRKGDCVAQ